MSFNELALNRQGLPHNPMINSGAIMSCSLIKRNLAIADRFELEQPPLEDARCHGHTETEQLLKRNSA